MKIVKYNISKAGRVYQDKQGVERKVWDNVGTLTEFFKDDGSVSRIIEIPAINLSANVYPIEPKQTQPAQSKANTVSKVDSIEYPEEDINPEDIPF